MRKISTKVHKTFVEAFGRTPLGQRLEDIMSEAISLSRFTDAAHLREELGDLLASSIELANEMGWKPEELVQETLSKIERRRTQYKTLGRKLKVAILGGAFDPITKGHIETAKFVLNTSKTFDEVWLMPCYKHMHGKKLQPAEHRLAMCELAAKCDGRLRAFDYEIKSEMAGETYQLVKRLQAEPFAQDKIEFSLIIGQDNANSFDKWVNYQELERLIRFVVVPRKGVPSDPNVTWYLKQPHVLLHGENTIPEISSTVIRRELKSGKSGKNLAVNMDPLVVEYIHKHHLYS